MNTETAKGIASLEACKKLYHIGELTSKLLPVGSVYEENFTLPLWNCYENNDDSENKRSGTKKRIRIYDKRVYWFYCPERQQSFFT